MSSTSGNSDAIISRVESVELLSTTTTSASVPANLRIDVSAQRTSSAALYETIQTVGTGSFKSDTGNRLSIEFDHRFRDLVHGRTRQRDAKSVDLRGGIDEPPHRRGESIHIVRPHEDAVDRVAYVIGHP